MPTGRWLHDTELKDAALYVDLSKDRQDLLTPERAAEHAYTARTILEDYLHQMRGGFGGRASAGGSTRRRAVGDVRREGTCVADADVVTPVR